MRLGRAARAPQAAAQDARFEIDGTAKSALEVSRNRLVLAGALFAVAFLVIAARATDVMVVSGSGAEKSSGEATSLAFDPERADIRDRNGDLLATSLSTASLYADPAIVRDPADVARRLARTLSDVNEAEILAKLQSDKRFVWLHRNLTPRQQYAVNRLGVPGLSFQREWRRVYPHGALAAHVVGFTGIDNHGLAGIERQFDEALAGHLEPLDLTIDIRVQHVVRDELLSAMRSFKAIGGTGVVLDAQNGELIAMVSLPDFDPNRPGEAPADARFNRATLGIYEMGSTFKIFTTAAALDSGTATLRSGYDATHPIHIGRFTIEDYHAKRRWLTVPEIFMYSSNIGAAKMALDLGVTSHRAFLDSLGFMQPAPLELPEIGTPMAPRPWREVNTMTIAFGHGLAVAPIQVVSATAAMVNGGILNPPTVIRRAGVDGQHGTRVISPQTSAEMRKLMRLVVEQGTGKSADVHGYLVGGKTGTAEKNGVGGYKHKALLSSFIGAFPITDPRYIVLVMLDEPKGTKESAGYATGGWVAAPAVSRIVQRIGPMLGVAPVDGDSPDVKKQLFVSTDPKAPRLASY
ncbi:MAG: penicillin-binding protein 2 [Alphaproteobacteria bacterium]